MKGGVERPEWRGLVLTGEEKTRLAARFARWSQGQRALLPAAEGEEPLFRDEPLDEAEEDSE